MDLVDKGIKAQTSIFPDTQYYGGDMRGLEINIDILKPTVWLCNCYLQTKQKCAYMDVSRHTIVCRAAQEAGAPHREYSDRKKENAIFTPM